MHKLSVKEEEEFLSMLQSFKTVPAWKRVCEYEQLDYDTGKEHIVAVEAKNSLEDGFLLGLFSSKRNAEAAIKAWNDEEKKIRDPDQICNSSLYHLTIMNCTRAPLHSMKNLLSTMDKPLPFSPHAHREFLTTVDYQFK